MTPNEKLLDAARNLIDAYRQRFTGGRGLFGPVDPELLALERAYRMAAPEVGERT